jgi:hypothetical protein
MTVREVMNRLRREGWAERPGAGTSARNGTGRDARAAAARAEYSRTHAKALKEETARMFGFGRKKSHAGKEPRPPDKLFFKSTEAAFEYACKFLANSIENESIILGIVFSTHGDYASIKLANSVDCSIPTEHPRAILEHGNIDNICFSARKLDRVSPLKKGDLVMFMVPRKIASMEAGCVAGLIVAKVEPIFSLQHGRWLMSHA